MSVNISTCSEICHPLKELEGGKGIDRFVVFMWFVVDVKCNSLILQGSGVCVSSKIGLLGNFRQYIGFSGLFLAQS